MVVGEGEHSIYLLRLLTRRQYHTVLITIVLQYNLKSGNMMPPALLFFFKIALAMQGLLQFYANFRINYSISLKDTVGILIGISVSM